MFAKKAKLHIKFLSKCFLFNSEDARSPCLKISARIYILYIPGQKSNDKKLMPLLSNDLVNSEVNYDSFMTGETSRNNMHRKSTHTLQYKSYPAIFNQILLVSTSFLRIAEINCVFRRKIHNAWTSKNT